MSGDSRLRLIRENGKSSASVDKQYGKRLRYTNENVTKTLTSLDKRNVKKTGESNFFAKGECGRKREIPTSLHGRTREERAEEQKKNL